MLWFETNMGFGINMAIGMAIFVRIVCADAFSMTKKNRHDSSLYVTKPLP